MPPAPRGRAPLEPCPTRIVGPPNSNRARRVLLDPPRDEDGQDPVTPTDGLPDHVGIVRRPRDDRHAPPERVEFLDTLLATHTHDLVPSIQRVPDHVFAELS